MDELKNTLEKYLDCTEGGRPVIKVEWVYKKSTQKNAFYLPNKFKTTFKVNKDCSPFDFSYPLPKFTNSHLQMHTQNKDLHDKVKKMAEYLEIIKEELISFNNIVVGSENNLKGKDNIVIGSRNNLKGSNYWVFDSDVKTKGVKDGVLIVKNYLIELTDIDKLLKNPSSVVRCLNKDETKGKFSKWWNKACPHLKISL